MSVRKHGVEHLPRLRKLQKALDGVDPINQMIAIELLMWSFAMRMRDPVAARDVAHAMHKHVLQMITQDPVDD